MKIGVTGHRPQKIVPDRAWDDHAKQKLLDFAITQVEQVMDRVPEAVYFAIGGALGWDTAVAQACVCCNVPYELELPHPSMSHRWRKSDRQHYDSLVAQATRVTFVHREPDITSSRFISALLERNKVIMDGSIAVLALWNGEREGGTYHALNYARTLNPKPQMFNAWGDWLKFQPLTTRNEVTITASAYERPRPDPVTGLYPQS